MNKKICVYAIAKNEKNFILRWHNSMKEADYVCVLDTGSTDGSFEEFKKLGIITKQKHYKQFRFDTARNDSMKLIPEDAEICVCVDLDEVFVEGWSKILKQHWTPTTLRARYRYTWNFNPDGSEGIVFMADKIHKNKHFKWTHPVHEVLQQTTKTIGRTIDLPQIQLNHYADNNKSRSSYLPLLELSVKEDPADDRNTHYLGREYMFNKEYVKAIETLKQHLSLPKAKWNLERSASLRYIANCYHHLKDKPNQEKYLILSCLEAPDVREPFFELGKFYFENKDYLKSALCFEEMKKISTRQLNYMSSPVCWGSLPYDYLSLCYYEIKDYKKAIENVDIAIGLSNEKKLKNNKEIFLKLLK